MIQFDCPHCGHSFQVGEQHAGQEGTCPSCHGRILVPVSAQLRPFSELADAERISLLLNVVRETEARYRAKRRQCTEWYQKAQELQATLLSQSAANEEAAGLSAQQVELRGQVDRLTRELAETSEALGVSKAQREQSALALDAARAEWTREREELNATLGAARLELGATQRELEAAQAELGALRAETARLLDAPDEAEARFVEALAQVETLIAERDRLETVQREADARAQRLADRLDEAHDQVTRLTAELAASAQALGAAQAQARALEEKATMQVSTEAPRSAPEIAEDPRDEERVEEDGGEEDAAAQDLEAVIPEILDDDDAPLDSDEMMNVLLRFLGPEDDPRRPGAVEN